MDRFLNAAGIWLHEAFRASAHRGDRVVEITGVVGLRHVECVNAVFLE